MTATVKDCVAEDSNGDDSNNNRRLIFLDEFVMRNRNADLATAPDKIGVPPLTSTAGTTMLP